MSFFAQMTDHLQSNGLITTLDAHKLLTSMWRSPDNKPDLLYQLVKQHNTAAAIVVSSTLYDLYQEGALTAAELKEALFTVAGHQGYNALNMFIVFADHNELTPYYQLLQDLLNNHLISSEDIVSYLLFDTSHPLNGLASILKNAKIEQIESLALQLKQWKHAGILSEQQIDTMSAHANELFNSWSRKDRSFHTRRNALDTFNRILHE
ncbi:MAG: hypothetical protein ACRC5A_04795 [Enterobacteriaceae bacterium]